MAGLQPRSSFGGAANRWSAQQLSAGDGVDDRILRYSSGEMGLECLRRLDERAELAGARRVAGGNHGDIILAQDRHAPRALAVKVVSLDRCRRCGDDEASLRKEVQALQELQGHHNLVQLVDVLSRSTQLPGAQGAPPYLCIAMEYVPDSEPLAGQIKRGGAQPHLALAVLPQLASALEFMHDRGFVHRDVWSENVLIGRGWHAVLVDLGSAERCVPGCRLKVPPKVNLSYASPEATESWGPQPGDDAWALGLLSAEMATGRFIGDILGRTDIPIHLVPAALKALLSEAGSLAGPSLGRVVRGLLAKLKDRLLMKDVAYVLRGEAPSSSPKMDWTPPMADSSPPPATPKVQPAQFRSSTSFASPSFAEMSRAVSPGPGGPHLEFSSAVSGSPGSHQYTGMRCQSTSPLRGRAPPPRVESKSRRSRSLAPSSSFNTASAPPSSPMPMGAARSLTFGTADLKNALAGFLRPTALSFTMPDFGGGPLTGSVAIPSRPRAQSPSFADAGDAGQPQLPAPPARSPAVGSRAVAPERHHRAFATPLSGTDSMGQSPPARQPHPSEQHQGREDSHHPLHPFGWSPPGMPSARGRQPGPHGSSMAPHAGHSPHHMGGGDPSRGSAPGHSPGQVAQATPAVALPPPPPMALQPMQLVAHLLPHGPPSAGSIAVAVGSTAVPPGQQVPPKASVAAPVPPLLMMCQSFHAGPSMGAAMSAGAVRPPVVPTGLQSPTSMRRVR